MTAEIKWPEAPTVHRNVPHYPQLGPIRWIEDEAAPGKSPLRKCSYCGSLHPQDLLTALLSGASLEASGWKYGWPHKFYVRGIPNPAEGLLAMSEGGTAEPNSSRLAQIAATLPVGHKLETEAGPYGGIRYTIYRPQGPTTHGKWYSEHFMDLSREAFDAIAPHFEKLGTYFTMEPDGHVKWSSRRMTHWETQ